MKKVLITGASAGIGLAVAKRLAAQHYQVTLVARSEQKLTNVLKEIGAGGHQLLVADLTNQDDLQKVITHLSTNDYDVLINNAGNGLYGRFLELDLQEQFNTMQLNMQALVALSFNFLQKAKRGDALINVGSVLAHTSLPGGAVYAATKSFVANFSESLWYEFKDKGIFVSGFNPGAAHSEFHANAGIGTKDFPKYVTSTVDEVADALVAALNHRGKPRVVQGYKNRLMLFGYRFLGRKTAVNMMGQLSPGIINR